MKTIEAWKCDYLAQNLAFLSKIEVKSGYRRENKVLWLQFKHLFSFSFSCSGCAECIQESQVGNDCPIGTLHIGKHDHGHAHFHLAPRHHSTQCIPGCAFLWATSRRKGIIDLTLRYLCETKSPFQSTPFLSLPTLWNGSGLPIYPLLSKSQVRMKDSIRNKESYVFKFTYFTLLQDSTRNANALATICPVIFMIAPFLQYWLFHLYHKYGHPWSLILYPDRDQYIKSLKKRKYGKLEADLTYFSDFWKMIEIDPKVTRQISDSNPSSILTIDSL